MENGMISIIVPVYNVVGVLERSIESIERQTYSNTEVLLVDDGSTDGSGKLCDELASRYDNIRVFHQKNGGAASARNLALQHTRGQYLMYVDSDDCIKENLCETLLHGLQDPEVDIACCGCRKFAEEGFDCKREDALEPEMLSRSDALRRLAVNYLWSCIWAKLYRCEIWDGIRFPEGKMNEDEAVMHYVYYRARKITYYDQALYGYYINNGGVMSAQFTPKGMDRFDAFFDRLKFYEEKGEQELYRLTIVEILDQIRIYGNRMDVSRYPKEREALRQQAKELIRKHKKECHISLRRYPHLYRFVYPVSMPLCLGVRLCRKVRRAKESAE